MQCNARIRQPLYRNTFPIPISPSPQNILKRLLANGKYLIHYMMIIRTGGFIYGIEWFTFLQKMGAAGSIRVVYVHI